MSKYNKIQKRLTKVLREQMSLVGLELTTSWRERERSQNEKLSYFGYKYETGRHIFTKICMLDRIAIMIRMVYNFLIL